MNRARPLLVVLLSSLPLAGGCVFVPAFNATVAGRDHSRDIGSTPGRRLLTVGASRQHDVLRVLGDPDLVSPHARRWYYFWRVRNGTWVSAILMAVYHQTGWRTLELQFDDAGVLVTAAVFARDGDVAYKHNPAMPALPVDALDLWSQGWKAVARKYDIGNQYRTAFDAPAAAPARTEP